MSSLLNKVSKGTKKLPRIFDFNEETGVETLKSIGSGVKKSVKSDLIDGSGHDVIAQITSRSHESKASSTKHHGDLEPGQELNLSDLDHKPKKAHHIEAAIENDIAVKYRREVVRGSEYSVHKENRELNQEVEEILIQLKQIVNETEELKTTFVDIAVAEKPVEVGKYHIGFFELMLGFIIEARKQIESAGSWLSAVQGKQNKKDYWSMFQKHGTSFGMSNERNVATQSG